MPISSALPRSSDWRRVQQTSPSGSALTVGRLLRSYEALTKDQLPERMNTLAELGKLAETHLGLHGGSNLAGSADFEVIYGGAWKEYSTIKNAHAAWEAARKVFAPSTQTGQIAKGKVLTAPAGPAPTGKCNYWLEAADPRHRSWGHNGWPLFNRWLASSTTMNFWEWVDTPGQAVDAPTEEVQYLDPKERWKYWVIFENKRLNHIDVDDRELEELQTQSMETAFSDRGFAIWVMSTTGVFYTNSHKVNEFHHSSFLAGKQVGGAGEWAVSDGRLMYISHKTGHYRCGPEELYTALQQLNGKTNLAGTLVQLSNYVNNTHKIVRATDFLTSAGSVDACRSVNARFKDGAADWEPTAFLRDVVQPKVRSVISTPAQSILGPELPGRRPTGVAPGAAARGLRPRAPGAAVAAGGAAPARGVYHDFGA